MSNLALTNIKELIQQLNVVLNGHFLLSSGRHSDEYWEKFRLLEWPRITEQLCNQIVRRHQANNIQLVVGPTTGGALLVQEVARQLGTSSPDPLQLVGANYGVVLYWITVNVH